MTVGFIGLGNMGKNMALRLLDQGVELIVNDIDEQATKEVIAAGARWAADAAELASSCELVLSSLPGPPQVEQVALGPRGIIEGIRADSLYVDLSTSSPTLIRRIDERFAEVGARAIDAPVSGGHAQCRAGTLTVMVGAEDELFERAAPVLTHLARELQHVGPLGTGSVAKLVNNAVGLSTLSLLSEVFALAAKAGFEHRALLKVLRECAYGQGAFLSFMLPEIAFPHRYDPPGSGFALALGRKDLGLATALGRELNVPMPMVNLVEQAAVELINRGHASHDTTILFSLEELRAGVSLHDDDAAEITL